MNIPIHNLYYLLSYSWDRLDEADKAHVDISDYNDAFNLFSRVLINGCHALFKKGLDKGYIPISEEYAGIKGKIDFGASLNRNLFNQGRCICHYDEFTEDTRLNQILRATFKRILRVRELDKTLKSPAFGCFNQFRNVSDIVLTVRHFDSVKITRSNASYDLLIKISRFIFDNTSISQDNSNYTFRDFSREPKQMAALFESFVRNFYKKEQHQFKVYREDIHWSAEPLQGSSKAFLPKMQTDISLESDRRKIIIDTKYYSETLSERYSAKFHSNHLYQLYAYLRNVEDSKSSTWNYNCEGIIIYPTVAREINQVYSVAGHNIRLVTLNLNLPWQGVHNQLLSIINL